MSDSKNQHYIPQSYLRNFAHEIRKKGAEEEYYVYVRFRGEKFHSVNIRNICSENYFYTLPEVDEKFKNFIEKSYADKIDVLYPKIYNLITDDNYQSISESQRAEIIVGCLTLYFRTPRFFKTIEENCKLLIEDLKKYHFDKTEKQFTTYLYKQVDLQALDFEKVSYDFQNKQKAFILREHYRILADFLGFKQHAGIGISKLVDESEFITCDNPVIIRNSKTGKLFDLYDPYNVIMLPINNKYLITILPNSEESLFHSFNRIESNFIQTLTVNIDIEKNSDLWIIGTQKSIDNHIYDQWSYNLITPKNLQIVEDMKQRLKIMLEFTAFLKSRNNVIDDEVVKMFVEISNNPLMKDDPNVIRALSEFRKEGRI